MDSTRKPESEGKPRRWRAREVGVEVGVMPPGPGNAITDIDGVKVGHRTIVRGDHVRTGVTAVVPHGGDVFADKVPAAIAVGNGFGKMAGYTQVAETGTIETPIVLTNTLSVGVAATAVVRYVLGLPGHERVCSVNPLVGETSDAYLNDIRGLHVTEDDVIAAIKTASSGPVAEGAVGAGTGTMVMGFKGGIGTSSRIIGAESDHSRTVGVLVQSNYGGILEVNGAPVGRELQPPKHEIDQSVGDGNSCMIVIATDAPLCVRNLERLANRSLYALARTGSHMSNGSGDYAIVFSTGYRYRHFSTEPVEMPPLLPNDAMTPLFRAVIEATEEAIYNSLLMAATVTGYRGHVGRAVPIDEVVAICRKYNVLDLGKTLPPWPLDRIKE